MSAPRLLAVDPDAPQHLASLYRSDPMAMPSQGPDVLRAADVPPRQVRTRLYTFEDGQRAALAGIVHGLGGAGRFAAHPPQWGYGGLVSRQPLTDHHVSAVLDDLRGAGYLRVQLRPSPLQAALWARASAGQQGIDQVPASTAVIDLSPGDEQVRARFHPDTRRRVRRAQRLGVEVRRDGSDAALDEFLTLLRASVDGWADRDGIPRPIAQARRLLRDPRSRMRRLRDAMGPGFGLYLASLGSRPVAGILVLRGHNAHYTRGAMDRQAAGTSGATTLLQATAIQDAVDAGCAWYLMGESAPGSGLERVKLRFGATVMPTATYRIERLPLHRAEQAVRGGVRRLLDVAAQRRSDVPLGAAAPLTGAVDG